MHPATKPTALIPTATRSLPLAVAAKGARIFDESGRDYIDASSGPLAVSLGHGHPRCSRPSRGQFEAVDYVHRTQFRNAAAEQLADLVTARLGGGLDHVLFVSSGSEANEVAMKSAHLYWAALGQTDKHRFASSSVSYHGNTAGALGASGQPRYAAPYRAAGPAGRARSPPRRSTGCPCPRAAPPRPSASPGSATSSRASTSAAPPPSCLRGSAAPAAACSSRRRASSKSSAACATPATSSGSATRSCPGSAAPGSWFAFQHANAVPDIVTFAKGPAAAPCRSAARPSRVGVWEQISRRPPGHAGRHTFTNAPLACAAGIATIEVLEEEQRAAAGHRARRAGSGSGCGRCRASSRSSATSAASATCGAWSSSPTRRRPRRRTPPST